MDEQNKPRSGRKFDDENVIDVEDNLSQYDEELPESDALDEEYIPAPPKRRNGLVAGVVLASLAVVGGGAYYYLDQAKPQEPTSSSVGASSTSSTTPASTSVSSSTAASTSSTSTTPSESTDSAVVVSPSAGATNSNADSASSSEDAANSITDSAGSSSADTTSASEGASAPKTTLEAVHNETTNLVAGVTQSAGQVAGQVVDSIDAAVNPTNTEQAAANESTASESAVNESTEQSAEPTAKDSAAAEPSTSEAAAAESMTQSTEPSTNDSVATEPSTSEATVAESNADTSASVTPPDVIPMAVSSEVQSALSKASTELNQLQSQLHNQAQEIEQLKGQLQEALHLNRQVSDQLGSTQSLQSLSHPLVLAEVIHLYNSASYEVQIAGNVEKAKRILHLAHSTALNAKDAAFNNLANGISADINVLNSSKGVNIDLLFQATTQLQSLLEQVRFISPDLQPQASNSPATQDTSTVSADGSASTEAAAESSWFDRAYDTTAQWAGQAYNALSSDIGGLIKVEKLSNPDLGIIPVDQVQVIRNNLKQDVRIAQDAMLKQEEGIWKTSLQNVLDNVYRYYDPNDERMETLVTLIKQLLDLSVKPDLPELKFTKEAIEQTSRELNTPAPAKY